MNHQMIVNIIIIVLLIVLVILHWVSNKQINWGQIEYLLKKNVQEQRDELNRQFSSGATEQFKRFGEIQNSIQKTLQDNRMETNKELREQLALIGNSSTKNIEKINVTLESKIKSLQASNEKRLEQMQGIVDEKLQKTLETRLTQSFDTVSKQLESVQQGLGEMKTLAADAKSLKNALTNVKDRGTYGEVRLERLLEDILAPNQYDANAEIANNKRVEFVIKLPGQGDEPLLLPIDSKFPIEDYNRLLDVQDKVAMEDARRSLATKIRMFAKEIHDKYIMPPKTTDFALMFLPTEGLYAEVVQNASLFEDLRDKYKVTVVGITTLSAFLSSLQIGFKTLAIEQRSQEVWDTLRGVKSEFVKFEGLLETAQKQITTAGNTIEKMRTTRIKAMNRKLREVEQLNEPENEVFLKVDDVEAD